MPIVIVLIVLLFSSPVGATVLFSGNFNSWSDWSPTQLIGSPVSCYTGAACGMGESWRAYNLQGSVCSGGLTGIPGYNTHYVNSIAGYPAGAETCRGGSGKCLTHWMEGCMAYPNYDSTDANLGAYLGAEYDEVYLRFYIRFSSTFTIAGNLNGTDGGALKLTHFQHWGNPAGSSNPWSYFNYDTTNRPIVVGSILRYGDNIYFNVEGRCVNSYYCDQDKQIWHLLGTYAQQKSSGILDGNWHSIIIGLKNNTAVGVANGLIEVWYDEVKMTAQTENMHPYNTYEFNDIAGDWRGWSMISVGGNNTEWDTAPCTSMGPGDCEQWYAIDDVVIATTYADAVAGGGTTPVLGGVTGVGISIR